MTQLSPVTRPMAISSAGRQSQVKSLMKSRPAKRNYGRMRSTVATVARERVDILLSQAREILPRNPDLAKRYVELAWKISMRTKVRIPKEMKHYLCKNCGQPLVLGKNARVRLRPGNPRIVITCLSCGMLRRYPFSKPSLSGTI